MNVLSMRHVVKQYDKHTAVNDVSFDIPKGMIFGLLGPNGAGKTSLIRIITSITAADSGSIEINGEPLSARHPQRIGYLPEERGLYKKMKVGEQLMYLAQLKGLSYGEAKKSLKKWFAKFGIEDWWKKKVEELSKGMQQKIQFIATVCHDPDLIILDEPFSGLDPINTNLIKDEIYELNQRGTSIIFSTHRMEQVEEICQEIVLINQGKVILSGAVAGLKDRFKENRYSIQFDGQLPATLRSDGFTVVDDSDDELVIQIHPGHDSRELLKALLDHGIDIKGYNEILPSLNEIFIKQVEGVSYE